MECSVSYWQTSRMHFPPRQNMTTSEEPSDLDTRIVSLVRQCWDEHRVPLLLSRLGGEYSGNIAREAKEQAGSLGAYLHRRLADRVRVVQHSTKPALIGAIPLDADTGGSGNFDSLLEQTRGQTMQAVRRFLPAFWAGFRKPLHESSRRYMSVHAPVHFRDDLGDNQPDGYIEIQSEHVVGPDAETTEVQQEIEAWLANNGLEPTSFLVTRTAESTQLPSHDLLGRLLIALDSDDLKRLSMPLDIVNKLRRHPL